MTKPVDLKLYFVNSCAGIVIAVMENGTIVELDIKTHKITSTGEAISPDELPYKDDTLWHTLACYPDESIVL